MTELSENSLNLKECSSNKSQITIRFQVKSHYCIFQSNIENYACQKSKFMLNNIEWIIYLSTKYGKISAEIFCMSKTPKGWSTTITSRLKLLKSEEKERQYVEYKTGVKFNKKVHPYYLFKDVTINSNFLKNDEVRMELWINFESDVKYNLDNPTLSTSQEKFQQRELQMKATIATMESKIINLQKSNEELRLKLAHVEEDKQRIEARNVELETKKSELQLKLKQEIANKENAGSKQLEQLLANVDELKRMKDENVAHFGVNEENSTILEKVLNLFEKTCCNRLVFNMKNLKIQLEIAEIKDNDHLDTTPRIKSEEK